MTGAGRGGGNAAMLRLAGNPKLRDFMLEQKHALAQNPVDGHGAKEREMRAVPSAHSSQSSSPRAPSDPSSFSAGGLAPAGDTEAKPSAGTSPTPPGLGVPEVGKETEVSAREPKKSHGSLPPPDPEVGKLRMLSKTAPWLDVLTPDQRLAILDDLELYDLWGACFANNLYDRCLRACKRSPEHCPSVVSGWDACIQYLEKESNCAYRCASDAQCETPQEVRDRLCPDNAFPRPSFCPPLTAVDKPPAPVVVQEPSRGSGDSSRTKDVSVPQPPSQEPRPAIEGCPPGKSPWLASDCMSFEEWQRGDPAFAERFLQTWMDKGFTQSQAKERWVYERNRDLGVDQKKDDAKWREKEYGGE